MLNNKEAQDLARLTELLVDIQIKQKLMPQHCGATIAITDQFGLCVSIYICIGEQTYNVIVPFNNIENQIEIIKRRYE